MKNKIAFMPELKGDYWTCRYDPSADGVVAVRVTNSPDNYDLCMDFPCRNCFEDEDEAKIHADKLNAKCRILMWMSRHEAAPDMGEYATPDTQPWWIVNYDEDAKDLIPITTGPTDGGHYGMEPALRWGDLPLLTKRQAEMLIDELPSSLMHYLGVEEEK